MKYLLIFFLLFPILVSAQKTKPIQIKIYPDEKYQVIDGFGASDAWRIQFVGKNWTLAKREKIADLLFSKEFDKLGKPKGIGLSIWRFNITAGTTEQGDSSGINNPWRRGECFLNADGTYNWSKQAGQQWFLKAAKERGVEKLLAFPNAPPVHISNNGKGYASAGDVHINIKPGMINDYSKFLIDVVEHFNNEGIYFDYLSPFNEPQWNWDGKDQEGTPALNEELFALVRYLSKDLSSRNLKTKMVIGEAGTIGHIAMTMDDDGRDNQANFFFNIESPFYVGDLPNVEKIISAHSYFSVWPLNKQVEYRNMLNQRLQEANQNLEYWQSEYCILQKNGEIGGGSGRDLGMSTALYVARIINNDLTLCNARSWQWWTAISQVDFKDGLIYLDDGSKGESGLMGNIESLKYDGMIRESKLLWTLGNYSLFIHPGMVRIKCDILNEDSFNNRDLLISAYKNNENGDLVYVAINLSEQEKILNLGTKEKVTAYITSKNNNLEPVKFKANKIILSERSVYTILK